WDDRLLAQQLKELSILDLDFSLEATGFEMGEIDMRIQGLTGAADAGGGDPAAVLPPESSHRAVSRPGHLVLLGRHGVYCGSALDSAGYAVLMDGEQAAMVFTDSPYNVR